MIRIRLSCRPFSLTPFAFLLLAPMLLCCTQEPRGEPVTSGIDKSAKVVEADFRRLFPCLNAGLRTWEERHVAGCIGTTKVENDTLPGPVHEIKIVVPLFDIADDDAQTRIRRDVPPAYGKVMQYLFPHWPQANAWLFRSLEKIRDGGCPYIAHVRDVWIIVQPFFGTGAQDHAMVTITRFNEDLGGWKKLNEPLCKGSPEVERWDDRAKAAAG